MLTKSEQGILSQCIRITNHHDGHFKHLIIVFISYTSIKLKK